MITTLTVLILTIVYLIPTEKEKTLNTNLEVEFITGLGTNTVYLINPDGYLVKTPILITEKKKEDQVRKILSTLTVSKNSTTPTGLAAMIPEKTKINDVLWEEGIVTIDFSKQFLNVDDHLEERMVESIVQSILGLGEVEGVKITVEKEPLNTLPRSKKKIPNILTKEFGINKEYQLQSRKDINKVVIYYNSIADDNYYYVPVTKYVNDSRDKVRIIVDNLTSNYIYEPNLMSFVNSNTKLLDYKLENDSMLLNFSDDIFTDEGKVLEEVIYSLSYSIYDNYEVSMVSFEVNGEKVGETKRSELEKTA